MENGKAFLRELAFEDPRRPGTFSFWQAGCDSSRQNNLACVISSPEELPERNGCAHQSFSSLLLYGRGTSCSALLRFSVQGFVLRSQAASPLYPHPLVMWVEVQGCDCSLIISHLPIVNHPQDEPHDAAGHSVTWLFNNLFPLDTSP